MFHGSIREVLLGRLLFLACYFYLRHLPELIVLKIYIPCWSYPNYNGANLSLSARAQTVRQLLTVLNVMHSDEDKKITLYTGILNNSVMIESIE